MRAPHLAKLCLQLFAITGCSLFLTGCSIIPRGRVADQTADEHGQQSEEIFRKLQTKKHTNTRRKERPWVSKKPCDQAPTERLPKAKNIPIVLSILEPTALSEAMTYVQKISGISFRLTADAEAKLSGKTQNSKQTDPSAPLRASTMLPAVSINRGTDASDTQSGLIKKLRYQGKLEGLLDAIASELNISWRYEANQILFYYLNTKTFSLYAIPSNVKINATVNSNMSISSGGGAIANADGKGQSNQMTSVSIDTDILADLTQNIALMITPGIGRYYAAQATGSVTVVDTEEVLKRIETYIDTVNKLLTKQVILNVKVLSLDFKNADQYEIDWKLIYKLTGGQTINWSTFPSEAPDFEKTGGIFEFSGNLPISVLNDAISVSTFVQALSQQAKVSVLTSPSVTTLNLQPVPVQVAEQEAYVSRVTSNKDDTGITYNYETDTLTSGLSMNLLPFLMENNQLLLQYSLSLSELLGKDEFGNADSMKIQLPRVSSKIFSQKVKLRSGQTLVLSGFEQRKASMSQTGPINDALWMLGGKSAGDNNRSGLLILINPIILE